VQSVYMDSPHDHHTFRLKKVSAAVAENRAYYLGRVLRNLQLKIRGGSNGTYVEYDDAAGDTQTHVAIEGDWPYSTDDNTNGKRPPEACIDAEVERSIWGLHEAAESLFDCQCFSGLHTERPARGAGAGRA
jgi:hypothetical protein